jgi:hypothetical protein
LELPAATPHSDLKTLLIASTRTRIGFGKAGDKQSRTIAASLKMSAYARNRIISHSQKKNVHVQTEVEAT